VGKGKGKVEKLEHEVPEPGHGGGGRGSNSKRFERPQGAKEEEDSPTWGGKEVWPGSQEFEGGGHKRSSSRRKKGKPTESGYAACERDLRSGGTGARKKKAVKEGRRLKCLSRARDGGQVIMCPYTPEKDRSGRRPNRKGGSAGTELRKGGEKLGK